jgi:hypothetical protein
MNYSIILVFSWCRFYSTSVYYNGKVMPHIPMITTYLAGIVDTGNSCFTGVTDTGNAYFTAFTDIVTHASPVSVR